VNQPLALVFYESLLPGTQLVNRLQDLGYRVATASNPAQLLASAIQDKPMLVLADLASRTYNVPEAIGQLRQNPATSHLPVIAFAKDENEKSQEAARTAGATLVVNDTAILSHLQQFLDQALQLD
jgi:CheY-like chemotaxis protein